MTEHTVKALQRALNGFTDKYLLNVARLRVDGDLGPATRKRVRSTKFYMGFNERDGHPGVMFLKLLEHPRWRVLTNHARALRGKRRRAEQRSHMRQQMAEAAKHGVGTFDGKSVARWMIPHLQWARDAGWAGWLVSGWRDPAYSEHLCRVMCGAPSCPGKCAGRASNHVGDDSPRGAIDVAHYVEFGQLMQRCPHRPRIFNALPIDPVHFSASGR